MNTSPFFLNPLYEATNKELCEKMGKLLKEARLSRKMTQEELAEKAGISRSQLIIVESTGKTSLMTFIALTRVLGGLQELFELYEVPELKPTEKSKLEQVKRRIIKSRKKYR